MTAGIEPEDGASLLYVNGEPVCVFGTFAELERYWLACIEDVSPGYIEVTQPHLGGYGLLDLDEVVAIRFRDSDTADVEIETHV